MLKVLQSLWPDARTRNVDVLRHEPSDAFLDRVTLTYHGGDSFQETFVIKDTDAKTLGEYGIGFAALTDLTCPDGPVLVELWLYDKAAGQTDAIMLIAKHTARRPEEFTQAFQRLGRTQPVTAKPGATICLELGSLCVCATVTEVIYADTIQNQFERLTIDFEVWTLVETRL